ncbi:hypothetical protein COCHEDRAFT_1085267, partial [Bipolaris maydis C5]
KVRPEKTRYVLPRKLLIRHSGLLRRELFENTQGQSLDLEGVSTEEFDVFVFWLYEKKLPSSAQRIDSWITFKMYIFADVFSVPGFKNALMDAVFHELSSSYMDNITVRKLFEDLSQNDPLLQLLVDSFCINGDITKMSEDDLASIDSLPKQYLTRVIRKLHQLGQLPEKEKKLYRADYNISACLSDPTDEGKE